MKESEFRILNECRVNIQQFECEFHLKFYSHKKITANNINEFMIGHEEFRNFIRGSVPNYDDDGNIVDFPEIQPQVNYFDESRRFSKSFLLTGNSGCGRHTVSDGFIAEMIDIINEGISDEIVIDDVFRYYKINLSDICLLEKPLKMKALQDMFLELSEIVQSEWSQEMMIAVCFDGVTDIFKSKKTAGYFTEQIRKLLEQTNVIFYFICIFEGKASEIRDRYKKQFIVYDILEPDEKMRLMYLDNLMLRYKNIAPKYSKAKLAQLTENFTFTMLEQFSKMYLMYAKSVIMDAGWKLQDYINNNEVPADDLILIPEQVLDDLIEIIRKSRYVQDIRKVPFVSVEEPNMLITQKHTEDNNNSEAINNSKSMAQEDDKSKLEEDQAEDEIFNLKSYEEMDEFFAMNLVAAI